MIGIIARLAVIVQGQQRDDVDAGTDNCAGAGPRALKPACRTVAGTLLMRYAELYP
jgi:hypothetical protein